MVVTAMLDATSGKTQEVPKKSPKRADSFQETLDNACEHLKESKDRGARVEGYTRDARSFFCEMTGKEYLL